MSRLNVGNLYNENEDGAPSVVGISTFSSPHYFIPPSGTTAQRPQNPGEGMIRFNTDSGSLEYYRGTHWENIIVNNNDLGGGLNGIGTTASTQGKGTRGVWGGGYSSGNDNTMDFVTIPTLGLAQDFGDCNTRRKQATCSSSTRGIFAGGAPNTNSISKFIFSSTGDTSSFSSTLTTANNASSGMSNETRGLFAGGRGPSSTLQNIDAITIASDGTKHDFGDLINTISDASSCSSPVRGITFSGTTDAGTTFVSTIEYLTLASEGNGQDFGDVLAARESGDNGASNSTRGLFAGGSTGSKTNAIEFITIATTGDSMEFGDLSEAKNLMSACSSSTRALFGGGYSPANQSKIESVEILSTGNAIDFGDLSVIRRSTGSCSNGHGGL